MFFHVKFRGFRIWNWLLLLLTVGWMLFIFNNSLQDGVESGQQSKRLLQFLQDLLRSLGFRGELSERVLRKLAHFGEFAILGFLVCVDLWCGGLFSLSDPPPRSIRIASLSVPFCFCIAGIDEFLQCFSKGRAPQFSDMLIDTSGALCATLAFLLLFFILRRVKRRKSGQTQI
ncbi:MAG: VanZ family protein [Clostridia bacterium]|nr:VanZ family protein [Clostridia bacterium]